MVEQRTKRAISRDHHAVRRPLGWRGADPAATLRGQSESGPGQASRPRRPQFPGPDPRPNRGPVSADRPVWLRSRVGRSDPRARHHSDRRGTTQPVALPPARPRAPTPSTPACSTSRSTWVPSTRRARRRSSRSLAITSSLFGLLRPGDRIPAYRLAGGVTLPGLGVVAAHWRGALDPIMRQAAGAGLVVDLRSSTYAAFWRPEPDLARRVVTVRVLHQMGWQRKVVSHFNKATKGRLVRALLEEGPVPGTPDRLADQIAALGWKVELGHSATQRPPPRRDRRGSLTHRRPGTRARSQTADRALVYAPRPPTGHSCTPPDRRPGTRPA